MIADRDSRDSSGACRDPSPCAKQESTERPPGAAASRRLFMCATLATCLGLPAVLPAAADENPESDKRPQPGDSFVFSEGDHEGNRIAPADIPLGGPPILAWPFDPGSKVVRDGSRLNQVLLLRLDPAQFDEETLPRTADGIVAYSAICAHAGCPVTGWVEDQGRMVLKCFCHNSEYDPRNHAEVVNGPASRRLAALPVKIDRGELVVASKFIGSVVPQQQS